MGSLLIAAPGPGHRVRQRDVLAELSAHALRGGGAADLLAETARLVALGLQAELCAILRCDGPEDRLALVASVGWSEAPTGTLGPNVAATACRALAIGEAVISDRDGDGREKPSPSLRRQGIARAIDVVIWSGGEKYGVIEAGWLRRGESGPAEIAFVQTAANLLGVALARDRTEAALAEEQARTSGILESISDSFYALDRDWRFTYLNRHCEEWCGRRRQDVIGRNIWEVFPQAPASPVRAAHLRAARDRRVVLTEVVSSVRPRWIELNIHPSATGLTVYFRDIHERKRAELALRESEQRLRLATEAGGIGTWEFDLATRRAFRSAGHAKIFGSEAANQFTITDFMRQVIRADRKQVHEARRQAFSTGTELRYTCRIRRGDGELRWIDVRGAPERDPSGHIARYFGVVIDVTERKEAEALRERMAVTLERRVAERTRALAETNARLGAEIAERQRAETVLARARRHEAVGQLVAGVAHSFNNLLTAMIGSLELLDIEQIGGTRRRNVERAMHAGLQAGALTHKLLMFAGQQHLMARPVDVNIVLDGMRDSLAQVLGVQVRLHIQSEPRLWLASGDADQLRGLLLNLAANARDALPNGGTVHFATRNVAGDDDSLPEELAAGDYVLLSITDDGVGMPPEVLAKACEPFFTTKRGGRGLGLGLAQADGVVRELGGTLRLRSAVGVGTTALVFLPRGRPPSPPNTRRPSLARPDRPPPPPGAAEGGGLE